MVDVCLHNKYLILFFFFHDHATTEIYTLSLHDALPISGSQTVTSRELVYERFLFLLCDTGWLPYVVRGSRLAQDGSDRKSTRLNSSHLGISYAVFCLKKKKHRQKNTNLSKNSQHPREKH